MLRSAVIGHRPVPRPGVPRWATPRRSALLRRPRLLVVALLAAFSLIVAVAAACGGTPEPPAAGGPTGVASAARADAEAGHGASPTPGAAEASPGPPTTPGAAEALMRERVLLLQGYIETYALHHYYEYPGAGKVRKGGALAATLWPEDPWTGRPLRPGTAPGTYTYTVAADHRSYRLVGHLPGRDYEVRGAMPHTGEVAYRHREQEGLTLIRQFVIEWARRHDGLYPPASEVSREGGVGALRDGGFWPSNPWNHGPMIQSDAVGDFAYEVAADRSWCRLTLHTSPTTDWTLECEPLAGQVSSMGD